MMIMGQFFTFYLSTTFYRCFGISSYAPSAALPGGRGPKRAVNAIIGVAAAFRLRTMTQTKACGYHQQQIVDM